MRKLGVSEILNLKSEIKMEKQLPMMKDAGFDCFFSKFYSIEIIEKLANIASNIGLLYETIHAPFANVNTMWEDKNEGDDYLKLLMSCVDMCYNFDIKKCIVHTTVHTVAPEISRVGLDRFKKLSEYARKHDVKIAYENLEIPEHLDAVLEDNREFHGFCWDCGHNHCYTPDTDMMARYSDRLICTHIHDNLGVKEPGIITFFDDLHLLPFDGNSDWNDFANKIKASKYDGPLTLELSAKGKNEYQEMPLEEMFKDAYNRADRLRKMCE